MKKNKVSKPRTIADLKFNWELTANAHNDPLLASASIELQNTHLKKLKIIPGEYLFLVDNHVDIIKLKCRVSKMNLDSVIELFEYLCWKISKNYIIVGHFSHFERIDDQTYRIHMKK